MKAQPFVLYEVQVNQLILNYGDEKEFDASLLLSNGRANYILFESFVGSFVELTGNSQGGNSDLVDAHDQGYEVKSFRDVTSYPEKKHDWFHTAASSTFGPNNNGPKIKKLLCEGKYVEALKICRQTGYDKNEFYVYANTAQFKVINPLQFIIIPTAIVLKLISKADPRQISRREVLKLAKKSTAL